MTLTLYTFGPAFGLPDPSPFVMKADLLLKMAGLPYSTDSGGFRKAPKGKLPYLRDGERLIADSTLIRWHLEQAHGIDFDKGYGPRERALGWTIEKMVEDQLYWALVDNRWMNDSNFEKGAARFFDPVPAPIRPLVKRFVRRKVRGELRAQGFGRHTRAEQEAMATRSIDALATLLGHKPYMLGQDVSGADAVTYAMLAGFLCPQFDSYLGEAITAHGNLVAYEQRMRSRYYPELTPVG